MAPPPVAPLKRWHLVSLYMWLVVGLTSGFGLRAVDALGWTPLLVGYVALTVGLTATAGAFGYGALALLLVCATNEVALGSGDFAHAALPLVATLLAAVSAAQIPVKADGFAPIAGRQAFVASAGLAAAMSLVALAFGAFIASGVSAAVFFAAALGFGVCTNGTFKMRAWGPLLGIASSLALAVRFGAHGSTLAALVASLPAIAFLATILYARHAARKTTAGRPTGVVIADASARVQAPLPGSTADETADVRALAEAEGPESTSETTKARA